MHKSGIKAPPFYSIKHLCVALPKSRHKKTIIFDLDETLIHCVEDLDSEPCHITIDINFTGSPEPISAGINFRPGVLDCLRHANKYFQVVVFTASEQEYADPILDLIDPTGELIQARFYRNSCVET